MFLKEEADENLINWGKPVQRDFVRAREEIRISRKVVLARRKTTFRDYQTILEGFCGVCGVGATKEFTISRTGDKSICHKRS